MSFTDHSYKEFLSWSDKNKRPPKNSYQINLPFQELHFKTHMKKIMNDPDYTPPLIMDLKTLYFLILFFYCTPPSEIYNFLEYHYDKYSGEKEDFIYFIEWTVEAIKIETVGWPEKTIHQIIYIVPVIMKKWIKKKRNKLKAENKGLNTNRQQLQKIKWTGSPSVLGFIILELVKKGFIEPPLYNGESNFTGLARLFYDYFDIGGTPGYFTDQLSEKKNNLSDTKRSKFTIPNLSDLA